jgi:AcrR family transcriptional regulator
VSGTRDSLLEAAAAAVREDGAAAASARTIAARAGVNQALVFYHFGTVSELIEAACRRAVDEAAGHYRQQFSGVTSLTGLLEIGRELDQRERAAGNVAMMAQLMSGAAHDPVLASASRYAMDVWAAELEPVLERLLSGSPLAELVDGPGLTRVLSASFIGLQLYQDVDDEGAARALESLEHLAVLVDVVNDLGPVARRAVRSRLRGNRAGARA